MHEYVHHYARNLTANKVRPTHVLSSTAKIILQLFHGVSSLWRLPRIQQDEETKEAAVQFTLLLGSFCSWQIRQSHISAHFWSVRGTNSAEYLPKLYSLIRLWNVFNIRYFSFCCIADIYNSRSLEIKNTRSSKKHYFPPKYVFEDALLTSVIKSLSTSVWSCRYNEVLCVYLWVVAWRIGALWQLWPQN